MNQLDLFKPEPPVLPVPRWWPAARRPPLVLLNFETNILRRYYTEDRRMKRDTYAFDDGKAWGEEEALLAITTIRRGEVK